MKVMKIYVALKKATKSSFGTHKNQDLGTGNKIYDFLFQKSNLSFKVLILMIFQEYNSSEALKVFKL